MFSLKSLNVLLVDDNQNMRAIASAVLHSADIRNVYEASEGATAFDLLRRHGLVPLGGCALFQWWVGADAALLHDFLARRGILTRLFAQPSSVRFGLPTDVGWTRLDQALQSFREQHP